MRMTERLRAIKAFLEKELCEGHEMKAPAPDYDITKIVRQQPRVYLGWQPTRPDESGNYVIDPTNVTPGIVVMPNMSYAQNPEEKRFDQYKGVRRTADMAQTLNVSMLFSVYEPGIRLPGFIDSADEYGYGMDLSKLTEGTEEGLMTLLDWMDDCTQRLLGVKCIPGSDLSLKSATLTSGLYAESSYIVDKRPIYYGFVNAEFFCYADMGTFDKIDELLN